jgi:hypothetical protein
MEFPAIETESLVNESVPPPLSRYGHAHTQVSNLPCCTHPVAEGENMSVEFVSDSQITVKDTEMTVKPHFGNEPS